MKQTGPALSQCKMWYLKLTVVALALVQQTFSAELKEVAEGKPGTQAAKVYGPTAEDDAARITDGNSDSVWGRTGTCSLVRRMEKPWITIDLGTPYYIKNVKLWLRGEAITAARDSNIEVRVGNSPDYRDNAVCAFVAGYFGHFRDLTCESVLKGRYLTVYRNDDVQDYLQVCEIQAFAEVGFIGSCACTGDPHCQGFDKAPYLHFMGTCSYTMMQDNCVNGLPNGSPSVEVIADYKHLGGNRHVSYVRGLLIKFHDYDLEIHIGVNRFTTVNGEAVRGTPFQPHPMVSITTTGNYVYVTQENGIRARYDGVWNAYVDISRDQAGSVCGICGNADGDASNDWLVGPSTDCMDKYPGQVPGSKSTDLNVVGTSWMTYVDTDPSCLTSCPQPPVPPGCTTVSQQKAEEHCDILRNYDGPFGDCLRSLPAQRREEAFDNCVFDSCSLELYDTIVCTFAKDLAELCGREQGIVVDWRTDDFCPLTCEAGMEYQACGNPCMPTCSDAKGENCGIPEGQCEEGCFCKAGKVFDGKQCIDAGSCGCLYEPQNVYIAVGETFMADDCSQTCSCKKAGGTLKCKDTACSALETCEVVDGERGCQCNEPNIVVNGECRSYIGACSCTGDPHCQSFDKAPYLHFMGSCSYTMMQDNCVDGLPVGEPSVEVIADYKKFNAHDTVSYVRGVLIKLHEYDMEINIGVDRFTTVNGEAVQGTPYQPHADVSITTTQGYVYVTVANGVRVRFDGVWNAYVDITDDMAGSVCGICGNADGDSTNDWIVGPSDTCMDKYPNAVAGQTSTDLNVVGTSWLATMDDDATCATECPQPPVPPGCTTVSQELAEEHCDILRDLDGPFGECLKSIPSGRRYDIFDNCVFDSCSLELYDEIVCTFAKELAELCGQEQEIIVGEWRSKNFCPLECPKNMVYKVCGNPCMPTCSDLKGENCGIPENQCEEGCFCKPGKVYDGEKCVSKSSCGCPYPEQNVVIAVGESIVSDDCSQTCECNEPAGTLQCSNTACSGLETCGEVDGKRACQCEEPNFLHKGKCQPPEFKCSLPRDAGTGSTKEKRFYFNQDKCKCVKFDYKGEGGNLNNFASEEECYDSCTGFETPEQCLEPKDEGTGDGSTRMYYYNPKSKKCKKFNYTGEGGNGNRFSKKLDCRNTCKKC